MGEYIEREALLKVVERRLSELRKIAGPFDHYTDGYDECVDRIIDQPDADVVEVVMCKGCRFWEECGIDPITNYHFGYCRHYQWQDEDGSRETNGQDYCSYGKRKDGGENE